MALYSDFRLPLKTFVKEQNIIANNVKPPKVPVEPLSGDSAKEFYENIINEIPTSKPESAATQLKSPIRSNANSVARVNGIRFKSSDLHKLAQNNEFETLERVLTGNEYISVDAVDSFGWTPLMCAACSRSREAADVLLKNKANPNICDKFGNSALSLAKKKNFDIIELIKKWDSSEALPKKKSHKSVEPVFCDKCNCEFHTDLKIHESSILHLFNTRPKNPKTFYGIPDCNRGFQLLLKNGWNREKGLGPKECGMKFPIKVTKKNDRIGIGGTTTVKSINEDKNALEKHRIKKKMTLSQDKRRKYFERNFRLQFLDWAMENPKKSLKYLEELENLGEEILIDKNEIIALDARRNQTREGLRAIKNSNCSKTWLAIGSLLIKVPSKLAEDLLYKDQVQVDSEINKLRSNLKVKVNDLRDLEHKEPVPGLTLNAMSRAEMNAMGQVLGRRTD